MSALTPPLLPSAFHALVEGARGAWTVEASGETPWSLRAIANLATQRPSVSSWLSGTQTIASSPSVWAQLRDEVLWRLPSWLGGSTRLHHRVSAWLEPWSRNALAASDRRFVRRLVQDGFLKEAVSLLHTSPHPDGRSAEMLAVAALPGLGIITLPTYANGALAGPIEVAEKAWGRRMALLHEVGHALFHGMANPFAPEVPDAERDPLLNRWLFSPAFSSGPRQLLNEQFADAWSAAVLLKTAGGHSQAVACIKATLEQRRLVREQAEIAGVGHLDSAHPGASRSLWGTYETDGALRQVLATAEAWGSMSPAQLLDRVAQMASEAWLHSVNPDVVLTSGNKRGAARWEDALNVAARPLPHGLLFEIQADVGLGSHAGRDRLHELLTNHPAQSWLAEQSVAMGTPVSVLRPQTENAQDWERLWQPSASLHETVFHSEGWQVVVSCAFQEVKALNGGVSEQASLSNHALFDRIQKKRAIRESSAFDQQRPPVAQPGPGV